MPEPITSAPAASTAAPTAVSTPPSPTPSAPSTDGDTGDASLSASIDALLSAPSAAPNAAEAPGAGSGDGAEGTSAGAPAATPTTPEPGASDPVVEASPASDPAPDEDDFDDSALDTAQDDPAAPSNLLDLKKSRGKRIYGAYKAYKAISEELGRELTVEDARQHLQAYSDKVAMEYEFADGSNNPAAAANWLNYWNQVSPQGMAQVANQLPEFLAGQYARTGDGTAYAAVALPVINRYVNNLYNQAQTETNPEVKKAMLFAARMVDWHVNDKFKQDTELPKPTDPLQQREQQLNARVQQIQSWEQQQQHAAQQQWSGALDTANNSALEDAVVETLAPIKSALPSRLYKAACRDFFDAVRQHLAKDVEGERIYAIQRNKAAQRMSSEDQQALAAGYAQRVERAARALKAPFLKEYGQAAQAASTQRHEALAASAAAGRAPTTAGQPVQQSIAPPKNYSSNGEKFDGMLDELLGVKR